MTEKEKKVIVTAIQIACSAPLKQSANTYKAGVPWLLIHQLRTSLDQLGLDWKKLVPK